MTGQQDTLFDAPQTHFPPVRDVIDMPLARALRDEALVAVDVAADDDWKAAAKRTVRQLAEHTAEFISDDVWATGLPKPREARALGSIMRWAAHEELIVLTDKVRISAQAGCHGMPRRVWRSLVVAQ